MKKITINTKALLNAVANANNYTSKDGDFAGAITIIGNDGKLEVKATDMIQTIIFKNIGFVSSDLTDPNFDAISLNGKKLATVLKAAKSEEVIIELDSGFVTVKSNRSRAKIETREKVQEIEIAQGYGKKLELDGCVEMMDSMIHAIDQNNPKYELNGLLIEMGNGTVKMVATDTRRLALVSDAIESNDEVNIIIPKQAVITATKLFGNVEIKAEANSALFSMSSDFVSYSTKLISGSFPEYQRIIPKDFSQTVILDAKSLAEVVTEASMFNNDVIISIQSKVLLAKDIDGNTETYMPEDETMDPQTDIFFAVDSKYILDVISSSGEKTVELCFNEQNVPLVLKAGKLKEVIMPILLPDAPEKDIQEAA